MKAIILSIIIGICQAANLTNFFLPIYPNVKIDKNETNFTAPLDVVTRKVFFDIELDGKPIGRLVFGLFGYTAPKTAENFRALCTGEKGIGKNGKPLHFKGNVIHRVVPGGWISAGDIIYNNGSGGESIYGDKFPDENFRLNHSKPFLLTTVNSGPDSNDS